jgi:hypothetical protein
LHFKWKDLLDKQEIIAYLAGFFEGDGSIMIFKSPPRGQGKSPAYRLVLTMTNTNVQVLRLAQKFYGGRIEGPFTRGNRWRPSFRWELDGENCVPFLSDIAPYIQTKHGQIQIAFKFLAQIRNCSTASRGKGYGSNPLSDSEIQARESLYLQMKHLNQRGTSNA